MSREGVLFQSTHPNAPASVGSGRVLELRVVHPHEIAGLCCALTPELVLGRAPEAGVACIPHATISRRHARLRVAMGGVLCVEDLGSRNGTRVDGHLLEQPAPLQQQALLRLGDVHAVVDEASTRAFHQDPVLPGTSPRLGLARQKLDEAARSDAPVLILGETGTGKERVAHALHQASGRGGSYVTLNCAELSSQLIESQLFGHERGAFTGATTGRPGLFAAAHGGTLFLDEIGELSLDLQPKLLRVLQEGEVRRVGSVETERFDTRVVAATNRDLSQLVEQGAFRRDLYARLAFHEIRLPPLRERRQDVLSWLDWLAARYRGERGLASELGFAPDAVERVLLHAWPDNLRGLDRLVHRMAAYGSSISARALLEALPELRSGALEVEASRQASSSSLPPRGATSEPPTRDEFLAVYAACGNSVRGTAKHFGKDRRQIYRWLERFGVPREGERE